MTQQAWGFPDEKPPLTSVEVDGVEVRLGDRVQIWPAGRADIFDLALEGKIGIVEAIEHDFDDKIHFALVLEDDPGRDLGMLRQPGHRFFFSTQEVVPLDAAGRSRRSP
jgi:hypothetical protein